MQFAHYLRTCRERYALTQEELVQQLYNYDAEFNALDPTALSRWERGSVSPSIERQLLIIRFFQGFSDLLFPCIEELHPEDVENELCKTAVENLIGKSRYHILKFPIDSFEAEDITITRLHSQEDLDKQLQMPFTIIKNLTEDAFGITIQDLKAWALKPGNLFLSAEKNEQFFGMFFSLRLKPDIFEKILNFKMELIDIKDEDFSDVEELGSCLPFGFFAYNEESAKLLFMRYYAHLLARQRYIHEVGAIPALNEAEKLTLKMNLKTFKSKKIPKGTRKSYRASLNDVLINENVIRMFFHKDPEEL